MSFKSSKDMISQQALLLKISDTLNNGRSIDLYFDVNDDNLFQLLIEYNLPDEFRKLITRMIIMSSDQIHLNDDNQFGILDYLLNSGNQNFIQILRKFTIFQKSCFPVMQFNFDLGSMFNNVAFATIGIKALSLTDRNLNQFRSSPIKSIDSINCERSIVKNDYKISYNLYEIDVSNISCLMNYSQSLVIFDNYFNSSGSLLIKQQFLEVKNMI